LSTHCTDAKSLEIGQNRLVRLAFAVVLLALVSAASVEARGGAAACSWRVVLDRPGAELTGVAALGDTNVWAVGSTADRGAILHWDGHGWWQTFAPMLPLDVAARSARDVWVVGSSAPTAFLSRAQTEHWDGRQWALVPVPGEMGSYLRGVSNRSSGVWAVGENAHGPLAVRWTGRVWRSALTVPADGLLNAVDGTWAAGAQGQSGSAGSLDPLVERLAGGRWRVLRTPRLDAVDENLLDVDAVSTKDVWAVGSVEVLGGRSPFVQHLVGRVWRDGSVDGLPETRAALLGVVAFGLADVWAVGYEGSLAQRSLLAHWDGKRWTQVPSRGSRLSGLSALSSHDIWAVGSSPGRSLIEHYSCS
jgi:hypothetical protein